MLVSQLDKVLAFVGSTGSTTISFILPGLFYRALSNDENYNDNRYLRIGAKCLVLYGIFIMILWLVYTFYIKS